MDFYIYAKQIKKGSLIGFINKKNYYKIDRNQHCGDNFVDVLSVINYFCRNITDGFKNKNRLFCRLDLTSFDFMRFR